MSHLIFGGTGSLGKKLIERFLDEPSQEPIYIYSRDEAKHWTIKNELASRRLSVNRVKFFVGDIRDYSRVKEVILQSRPKHIIIAAALKQVDTCELSPFESVKTNLLGTQNVVDAVNEISTYTDYVKTVLFVSTDKACSPVNAYGMCKAVSERLVTSQSERDSTLDAKTRFVGVRYGNVLESRGSIIPLFKYQAENFTNLTVTNSDMTRFVMTLNDSVDLIQTAIRYAENGEIFIPKLPAMKIGDLAEIFSELYNKPIKVIGLRPGEKMHEELINESESIRSTEFFPPHGYEKHTKYTKILPAFVQPHLNRPYKYTSADDVMTKEQLKNFLIKLNIIDMKLSDFEGLKIEEINTRS